jgi:hypothetical protein
MHFLGGILFILGAAFISLACIVAGGAVFFACLWAIGAGGAFDLVTVIVLLLGLISLLYGAVNLLRRYAEKERGWWLSSGLDYTQRRRQLIPAVVLGVLLSVGLSVTTVRFLMPDKTWQELVFYGALLGILLAGLPALEVKNWIGRKENQTESKTKVCPACQREIPSTAVMCKFCQAVL